METDTLVIILTE
jgi:chromosome segregation ATPase